MKRIDRLRPQFVDFIPEALEQGTLYVSRRYATASHLCCCGCGLEVVTPLNSAKWRLIEKDGGVAMSPSIGNLSFPCGSHYWIKDGGRISWAGAMSAAQIAAVKAQDRRDASVFVKARETWPARVRRLLGEAARRTARYLRSWW